MSGLFGEQHGENFAVVAGERVVDGAFVVG
jgi:hypothetical protein